VTAVRTYLLPFPPSVNHYWKNARRYNGRGTAYNGKVLTDNAKAFRANAIEAVLKAHGHRYPTPITGRLDVTLTLYWPDLKAYDVDNYSKGVLDALTHARVWHDDVQVRNQHQLDGEVVNGGAVLVEIRECLHDPVPFPE
jgi:crossover junction endodeoxyribonuclease RusA